MKKLATTLALLLFITLQPARAQSPCKMKTIERLVNALTEAYDAKALGRLDASHPYFGRVKIIIEHSLNEDHYETKAVNTLAKGERWLKSREREDNTPFRETRPLIRCRRGICTFDFDGGILHNHLYIKRVTYGYRNGCPYLKTILLLDGD